MKGRTGEKPSQTILKNISPKEVPKFDKCNSISFIPFRDIILYEKSKQNLI